MDSCFVLIGTRQHGVAVLYETSNRASSNKMQQNPCPIKFRTLNLPAPRITRCHTTCLREKADKASNSCLAKSTECRWPRPWPFKHGFVHAFQCSDGLGHLHSVDFARQEFDALSAFSLRHVVWQRVIRGAGRFKVRNLIGHGFCCILFELALLLVSYGTATPC